MSRSDEQTNWEIITGWEEVEHAVKHHPVKWVTGTHREWRTEEVWPTLSAWDHAFPVRNRDTGEHAYLLMPYGLSEDAARALTEWCEERDMRWEQMPAAGWWNTATVAILVCSDHE